jgi:hypothetical protein
LFKKLQNPEHLVSSKFVSTVKILFLVLICSLLMHQISKAQLKSAEFINIFERALSQIHFLVLIVMFLIGNYILEAIKWQLLTQSIAKRSMGVALKEVLVGLSAGILTPFMVGDFIGRIWNFKNKKEAFVLNVYNSFIQSFTAIVFGWCSLMVWKHALLHYPKIFDFLIFALGITIVVGFLFLFFNDYKFLKSFRIDFFKKYLAIFDSLRQDTKFQVLGLAMLRNVFFVLQYLLVFWWLGEVKVEIKVLLVGINLLLLVKTIGGGLNILGDISTRQLFGLYFFGQFSIAPEIILSTTLFVWVFNIFVPALVGVFLIKSKK